MAAGTIDDAIRDQMSAFPQSCCSCSVLNRNLSKVDRTLVTDRRGTDTKTWNIVCALLCIRPAFRKEGRHQVGIRDERPLATVLTPLATRGTTPPIVGVLHEVDDRWLRCRRTEDEAWQTKATWRV